MMYIVVQTTLRKWIVAQKTGGAAVYRKACECDTEYGAKVVRDALEAANAGTRKVAR